MDFTFGIITDGSCPDRLAKIFRSIEGQNIPNYEIIVVGGKNIVRENVTHIPFEEITPKAWITRKKNIVTEHAQYENVVYMHDYFALDAGWYREWHANGDNFEVAINCNLIPVTEDSGWRGVDWAINPYDYWKVFPELYWKSWDVAIMSNVRGLETIQFVPGGYWVAKKAFMKRFPLDETLFWGDSEDCRWSETIRQHTTLKYVPASVLCLKPDKWKPTYMPKYQLDKVAEYFGLTYTYDEN